MFFAIQSSSVVLGVCLAVWFAVAVISLIVEIETFQLVSVWFFIGAVAAIITTAIAPKNSTGVIIQLIVFILVSILALLLFRPLCKKKLKVNPEVSKDINSMIGQRGVALTNIDQLDGLVQINDTRWSARSSKAIEEGSKIKIVKQDNIVLQVEEIKEEESK